MSIVPIDRGILESNSTCASPAGQGPPTWEALATGESGDVEIEKRLLQTMESMYHVFCAKQKDYGRENIARFGLTGVMVRLTDKMERLIHLWKKGALEARNEPIHDTWLDIALYGVIGLMVLTARWPGAYTEKGKWPSSHGDSRWPPMNVRPGKIIPLDANDVLIPPRKLSFPESAGPGF